MELQPLRETKVEYQTPVIVSLSLVEVEGQGAAFCKEFHNLLYQEDLSSNACSLTCNGMYEPNFQNVSFTSNDPLCDINRHSPLLETYIQLKNK